MLIAGRTIQGVGGGGVTMLVDLIVCDLVPLRERGSVMGIIFGAVTLGTALGPFVGGIIVQRTTWRWVFYLNIPIGSMAIILLVIFLHAKHDKTSTLKEKITRVDLAGNAIFVLATTSILIALTNGGTQYSWSTWRTLMPLTLGVLGLGLFYLFEKSKLCREPSLPPHLFANRTSAAAFGLTFVHTLLLYWEIYFLPVYFQAVLGSTPARSGVQLLPTVILLMVFGAVGGAAMQKFGTYRPFHHAGFALMAIGLGCFTTLNGHSSAAIWVVVQCVFAAGTGLSIGTLLAAAQAELSEADSATATGTWAVIRSFGTIWGITLSAVVFNNQFEHLATRISDPTVRYLLSRGQAYEHATGSFVNSLRDRPELRGQIIGVYTESLRVVWQVATGISALGFCLVFVEKQVKLRTELHTEFGLETEATIVEHNAKA
ncbi:MAG: hypothetical protein Q9184_001484 [Pyrenodesmia sp. 2 TL-2023]